MAKTDTVTRVYKNDLDEIKRIVAEEKQKGNETTLKDFIHQIVEEAAKGLIDD